MKNFVIGFGVIFVLATGYYVMQPGQAADPCKISDLKATHFDVGTQDKILLQIRMGHSFGEKLGRYTPHLKSVQSSTYYKDDKRKPMISYLTTEFKGKKAARSAYKYLKRKWRSTKKKQYDVILHGKSVTWYTNNRMSAQCFTKAVAANKSQLKDVKNIASGKEKNKVVRKSFSKKKSLKKSRRVASVKKKKRKKKTRRKLRSKRRKRRI